MLKFNRLRFLIPVLLRLGIYNVAVVFLYRLAARSGLFEKRIPKGEGYREPLFRVPPDSEEKIFSVSSANAVVDLGEEVLEGKVPYFSFHKFSVGSPPDWFLNPVSGQRFAAPLKHWSSGSDFDPKIGDIKMVWEASRFDWVLILVRAFKVSGDPRYLRMANDWASDWTRRNPLNAGPNWKCGQEASIRMLQVLLAAFLLQQHTSPAPGLVRFVSEHCSRIEPTIHYAMAQDNNHGTSEASALFIGGAWLEKATGNQELRRKAIRWHIKGRRYLENRLDRIVAKDGSFSQHSVNYHRVLVDTLNIVEFWRRELAINEFSQGFYSRSRAALTWLYQMVDEVSGDAPNIGSNDGARLFVLSSTDYRDYRPSVQLGAILFFQVKFYPSGPWDEPLFWLSVGKEHLEGKKVFKKPFQFSDGGYVSFHSKRHAGDDSWAILRYPRFRFRPGHADALHFDLWHRGVNILRDSGSFSYNTEEPWQSYFSSTAAHNTIEFDERDQMPRISRFLRGAWLKMNELESLHSSDDKLFWAGAYTDYKGSKHKRSIYKEGQIWRVIDELGGTFLNAVLRWRLAPGNWKILGSKCVGDLAEINIDSNVSIIRIEVVEGWESRYYLQRSKIPVLEVQVDSGQVVLISEIFIKT